MLEAGKAVMRSGQKGRDGGLDALEGKAFQDVVHLGRDLGIAEIAYRTLMGMMEFSLPGELPFLYLLAHLAVRDTERDALRHAAEIPELKEYASRMVQLVCVFPKVLKVGKPE